MLKFLGLMSLMFSSLVLAAGSNSVLTCEGKLETTKYGLRVVKVTGLTDEGTSGSFFATLRKNGKLAKATKVVSFDNGANKDYGYQNKRDGLNVSITHIQLADIPFPYARGVLQLFVSDTWLNVPVMCNTKPVR